MLDKFLVDNLVEVFLCIDIFFVLYIGFFEGKVFNDCFFLFLVMEEVGSIVFVLLYILVFLWFVECVLYKLCVNMLFFSFD